MLRWGSRVVVGVLASALALGCGTSSDSSGKSAEGGTGGAAGGVSGGAGSGGHTGGTANTAGSAGALVSSNPLCPTSGPVVAGSTPLPDGVEVASTHQDARLLVVSDSFAYWANGSIIRRISVAGNAEEVIVDRSATKYTIQGIAIDDKNVYFTETGLGAAAGGPLAVAKAPLDGKGEPVSIANEGPGAASSMAGLTVADGYVYYFNLRTAEIARVSVDGGTPTVMVRGANPSKMTVAGGYLWFMHPITNNDNSNLIRVALDAEAPPAGTAASAVNVPPGTEAVAPVFNYQPTAVSADAQYIYYDDENKVMRIPIAGGTPELIAQAPDHSGFMSQDKTYVDYIVPSASGVFWDAEGSNCGYLMKSALDGSSSAPLVNAVGFPSMLGVNATHLYFNAAGQILRVPL